MCRPTVRFTSCRPIHPPAYQISIPTSINFGDMGVQKLTKWGLLNSPQAEKIIHVAHVSVNASQRTTF